VCGLGSPILPDPRSQRNTYAEFFWEAYNGYFFTSPNIAVECRTLSNRNHLKRAGADEIISSDDLGLRLLAMASLFHGMTHFYQELLTVGRDANEIYLLPAPEGLVGKPFRELSRLFANYREDKRSCLIIGIQRGEEMMINPIAGEAGPLQMEDQLILLSRVFPSDTQPLPTATLD
jgi:voltage-gated potassium channel